MNLRELKNIVDKSIENCEQWNKNIDKIEVCVKTIPSEITVGSSSVSDINSAGLGFD